MLKIEFTDEVAFGESGPNLVIIADIEGITLLQAIIKTVLESSTEIEVSSKSGIQLIGINKLILKCSDEGLMISKLNRDAKSIQTNLKPSVWSEWVEKLEPLKKSRGHQYLESDEEHFIEEVNIIVQSI